MKLARIKSGKGVHQVAYKDGSWQEVEDIFAKPLVYTGSTFAEADFTFLAPVTPGVILGMAHNGTPDQINNPAQAFHKSTRTLAGPNDPIYKDDSRQDGQDHPLGLDTRLLECFEQFQTLGVFLDLDFRAGQVVA